MVTRKDFAGAMQFVNAVAEMAEAVNHHPDIAISWNKVTLRLTSHDAGGLTQPDVDLAAGFDGLDLSLTALPSWSPIPPSFPPITSAGRVTGWNDGAAAVPNAYTSALRRRRRTPGDIGRA